MTYYKGASETDQGAHRIFDHKYKPNLYGSTVIGNYLAFYHEERLYSVRNMNSDWVCLVKAPNPYEAIEKVKKISEQKKESETSSHSEKDILKGCISLMNELTDRFMDFLDYTGYEPQSGDDEFQAHFSNFHIVQKLFLRCTAHSGGTSTRKKCYELGLDPGESIWFGAPEEKNEE